MVEDIDDKVQTLEDAAYILEEKMQDDIIAIYEAVNKLYLVLEELNKSQVSLT